MQPRDTQRRRPHLRQNIGKRSDEEIACIRPSDQGPLGSAQRPVELPFQHQLQTSFPPCILLFCWFAILVSYYVYFKSATNHYNASAPRAPALTYSPAYSEK